ncbi:MAG: class I SAM-dependent methyltransferase [Bacteroidota bacterium]|nr:class I SAM-dependent methyltransferase [Bacteroidota bacterium]
MNTTIPDNWYETFFSGINCEMWEKAPSRELTNAEVAFIEDVLNLSEGNHILDIPCGTGRHSIELAKHGFQLTAVDISNEFINGLKKKVAEQQLNIEIIHANILSLKLSKAFDGAFTLGNSFGYFPFADMEKFVETVSLHLRQGGKWIINTGLIAESFLAKFIKEKKYELDGLTMEINNDYDEWNSCLLTTLTYTKNGKQEVHQFKHHVYTVAELIRLLNRFDLKTIALYNSTDKKGYRLGDEQLFLVAEKI